jgi:hypothetical protein
MWRIVQLKMNEPDAAGRRAMEWDAATAEISLAS